MSIQMVKYIWIIPFLFLETEDMRDRERERERERGIGQFIFETKKLDFKCNKENITGK